MLKKKSICNILKLPWLNFFLAIILILSPFILEVFEKGERGSFIHNLELVLPTISRVLAFIFLVFGLSTMYKNKYKKSIYFYQNNLKNLKKINWIDFELLIASYFKKIGFTIKKADAPLTSSKVLEIFKGTHEVIICCEYWNTGNLNSYHIKEVYNKNTLNNHKQLYVITIGNFTTSAKEFAQGKNIELINGYKLVEWKSYIENN